MKESKQLQKIKNLISPFTKRAYFVGGSVRDEIFNLHFNTNLQSKDFDIEIYDISPQNFAKIMQNLKANGVGKNFFVYKYQDYDLSLPRTENKISFGHRGFEVKICNDEKIASKRRDFTINALMKNIFTGEILDFYGGISDIKNRRLKIIDSKSFVEDSLRILRGIHFATKFNLKIEKNSFEIMKNLEISDLSKDRISAEMIKIFRSKYKEKALKLIFDFNIFKDIFGFEISKNDLDKTIKSLKNSRKFIEDERLFLYILCNENRKNPKEILENLHLNNFYKTLLNEPFFRKISPKILMQIAIKMPLKNWLGSYNKKRIALAKKLQIYDKKFDPKINIEEILDQGFKKQEIAQQISKLKNNAIEKYLQNFKK